MRSLGRFIKVCVACCFIIACDYGNVIEIQQKSEYYDAYVDSVTKLAPVKSFSNWKQMTKKHDSLKNEVVLVSKDLKKDNAINELIKNNSKTFDTFKTSSINAFKKLNSNDSIQLLQKRIFNLPSVDLRYEKITQSNILQSFVSFENFLDEYSKSLSKADWRRVHIIYDALDHRKKNSSAKISDMDKVEINKIQPKIFALIKLNDFFKSQ